MQKIKKLLHIQYLKYQEKGITNICIALMLLSIILVGMQRLGKTFWPQDISDKPFFVAGISFCIHFIFQFSYFLIYVPGYFYNALFYKKYRINKGVTRPWELQKEWPQTKRRLFKYLGINYFIVYPLMILFSTKVSGLRVRFDDFPTVFEISWQLVFVAFVEDTFFYWAHRLAHTFQWLYKYHKIHHQYTQVFSLVTEFTHPIDYVIGILIPSAIPFILLGSKAHCFMFFFWQIWKIFISTQGHCGYEFPWSPTRIFFFVSAPSFHDFHHSKNIGNYCGSIYLWDYFNNSSEQYWNLKYPVLKNKSI